jgi:hypothetical protein
LLCLGLRLVFIFHVSTIPVIWDAEIYWNSALRIRSLICADLHYCSSAPPDLTWAAVVRSVVISREGLAPTFFGALLTIFPADPKSVYVVFAVLDSLVCLIAMGVVIRLGAPIWVGALTGVFYATYVPAIVSTAAFLQQPFIRFWLAAAVFSYASALASSDDRAVRRSIRLGTLSSLVLAFSSTTTRPLLWVGPMAVVLISVFSARALQFRIQLREMAILAVMLAIVFALTLAMVGGISALNLISVIATGIPFDRTGSNEIQVTVLSFQDFWPPTDWYPDNVPFRTRSLVQDFLGAPGTFVRLWTYSIFANLAYPDHLYFQHFLLDLHQQELQHSILVVLGLIGLSWAIGGQSLYRYFGILIATFAILVTLSSGVISVEPRRLSVLAPFWCIGAGWCLWSLHTARDRRTIWTAAGLAGAALLLWQLPVPVVLSLGVSANTAFEILMVARLSSVLIFVGYLAREWRLSQPTFSCKLPIIAMTGCLAITTIASFHDDNWREWSANIATGIRQIVNDVEQPEHLWPWLIVDISEEQVKSVSISVNGERIKEAGTRMNVWEAGVPPQWQPYARLFALSGGRVSRAMWSAIPIPRHLTASGKLTIEIEPASQPFSIRGDLAEPGVVTGPLFDPWITGHSLWRWIWNASDPRISRTRPLQGGFYTSARLDENSWNESDLSPALGKQTGRYRIYLTQAAFGPQTNALAAAQEQDIPPDCGDGNRVAAPGKHLPYICQQKDGSLEYLVEGNRLGISQREVFATDQLQGELIDRITGSKGRVDVIKVLKHIFVANFYAADESPIYSLIFRLD